MADSRPTFERRNHYGRRFGPRLRPRQQHLYDKLLPRLRLPINSPTAYEAEKSLLSLFGGDVKALWLEIGFGAGEHLYAQAATHPDVGIIGCEPYVNGVASFLSRFEQSPLANIRLHDGDARDLMDVLPEACLARVFLLFPDPWPKKRHNKRRFVQPDNLDALARVMCSAAKLVVATDIEDYCRSMLIEVARHGAFEWLAETPQDWRHPPKGATVTRYETKAIQSGRKPVYLTFSRRGR